MGPLVPVVLVLIGGTAYKVHRDKKNAKLTPKRKMILETAMNSKLTPDQLTKLADSFEKEGLKVEADLLRKRVDLQLASPEQKKKWQDTFKKAMHSENITAINAVADAFEDKGATGAAADLRKRAQDVKTGAVAVKAASAPAAPPFVPPPAAVAAVVPPTAPTVGPESDLTSSMNQGQVPVMHPVDQAPPAKPLTQTGAPGGPSGLGETTVLPTSTATLNTPAAIAASATAIGLPPVLSPSAPAMTGAPGPGTPAGGGSVGSMVAVASANPTVTGPVMTDGTATVGHPSDLTSPMNQQ